MADSSAASDAEFKQALALRDSDPEACIQALGAVLEHRNRAFGESAPECAEVYLAYGQLLFEQAQANADCFGDQMRSAALQRARAIAAADGDNGSESSEDSEDSEAEPAGDGDVGAGSSAAAAAAAVATAGQQGDGEEDQGGRDDKQEEAEEEEEEDDDDDEDELGSDSQGEDVADHAETEGDAAPPGLEQEQAAGDGDDMALAWEMLEMARLCYEAAPRGTLQRRGLADCRLAMGDVLCEQERFEDALTEYDAAGVALADVYGRDLATAPRRAAELQFKRATALELLDRPEDALSAMRDARRHLAARLDAVSGSSSGAGDAPAAAAAAAFAAVLGSYAAPAAAPTAAAAPPQVGGGTVSADSEAAAADAAEAAELRSLLEDIDARVEELAAAAEAHESMRESLRSTFAAVAAGLGGGDEGDGPENADGAAAVHKAPAPGVTEAGGFSAPSLPATEVRDIGVVGRGRRSAPAPALAPPAAAAASDSSGGPAVVRKRPASDVASSDQEGGAPGGDSDSAVEAAGKAAPVCVGSGVAHQQDAALKRARA